MDCYLSNAQYIKHTSLIEKLSVLNQKKSKEGKSISGKELLPKSTT